MNNKEFQTMLPLLTAAIAERICAVYHLNEDDAIRSLYSSRLYDYLEDEHTKVWHYSVNKLFDLYQQEVETGCIDLPDW